MDHRAVTDDHFETGIPEMEKVAQQLGVWQATIKSTNKANTALVRYSTDRISVLAYRG